MAKNAQREVALRTKHVSKRFEGKLAVITGAAGGMGLAFAQRFAAEGAALILADVDDGALCVLRRRSARKARLTLRTASTSRAACAGGRADQQTPLSRRARSRTQELKCRGLHLVHTSGSA